MREIRPQQGRQEQFLSSPADICIYGGAAGGGKTWSLLLDPIRYNQVDGFGGMILRRTYPEITNLGGLWDESEKLYPYTGASGVRGDLTWRWPSGVRIEFSHLQYEADLQKYDGAQIPYLAFDQLEHFTEKMFFYMAIRNRSTCKVRSYCRATCNPDPDSFLASFLSWWIADDGYADLDRAGKTRWFVRYNDQIHWGNSPEELTDVCNSVSPALIPRSVSFIPATVYDNKILMDSDPSYLANLQSLPLVERERFLGDMKRGGNWKVRATAGKIFNRSWIDIVPSVPNGGIDCRGWDFAATEKSLKNKDPDYTAGVKMRKVGGIYYVLDVINERYPAGQIDNLVNTVANQDLGSSRVANAKLCTRWEIEPGSAGIRESVRMTQMLAGMDAIGVTATGDKVSRWRAMAAAAEHKQLKLVAGAWNDQFLGYLHGVPDTAHDDAVDAAAIAYNELAKRREEPANNAKQNQSPLMALIGAR